MHPQSLMSRHALEGCPLWLVPMLVGVALMLLLPATAARAASFTFTVNSPAALWAAIQQANGRPPGTHTIIDLEGKPYALQQSPLPSIKGSITIRGVNAGLTSISGSCTKDKTP